MSNNDKIMEEIQEEGNVEKSSQEIKEENIDNPSQETQEENIEETSLDPIEILEKEKKDLRDAYLRLSAETDNYRKRIQQEKEIFKKIALKEIVEKLLPVVDNLERSIHAANTSDNIESLREGVFLVLNQFEGVLTDVGLETIEIKVGDEFDPQYCEAVMMETKDDVEHSMTVVEVFESGKKLGGQVLRTAKVKVAKKNN